MNAPTEEEIALEILTTFSGAFYVAAGNQGAVKAVLNEAKAHLTPFLLAYSQARADSLRHELGQNIHLP